MQLTFEIPDRLAAPLLLLSPEERGRRLEALLPLLNFPQGDGGRDVSPAATQPGTSEIEAPQPSTMPLPTEVMGMAERAEPRLRYQQGVLVIDTDETAEGLGEAAVAEALGRLHTRYAVMLQHLAGDAGP